MTRLECSAWPLAGGAVCVLVLAVVLDGLPWPVAFVAVVGAVAAWAWASPLVTGAVLGGIAWLCVTGFDVHRFGDITVTGSEDALRAAVLVFTGVLAASVHAVAEARRARPVRPDPSGWASTKPRSTVSPAEPRVSGLRHGTGDHFRTSHRGADGG
jgi:hypothetical protein